jgi:hypothetical protein
MIISHIKNEIKKLSLKDLSRGVSIIPGSLGTDAVSIGAAFLASREVFLKS